MAKLMKKSIYWLYIRNKGQNGTVRMITMKEFVDKLKNDALNWRFNSSRIQAARYLWLMWLSKI